MNVICDFFNIRELTAKLRLQMTNEISYFQITVYFGHHFYTLTVDDLIGTL